MAQCPKCNEPIREWTWFNRLLGTRRKRVEFECPRCGITLIVKESIQPSIRSFLVIGLVTVILFTLFHRLFFKDVEPMSLVYRLVFTVMLIEWSYFVAIAFGVHLDEAPPPKKFYDPDRLD